VAAYSCIAEQYTMKEILSPSPVSCLPPLCLPLFVHFLTCLFLSLPSTEIYSRQSIRKAKLISNPGCYSTSIQALVAPLIPFLDPKAAPTIFGLSGYSGAGTKAAPSGTTSSSGGGTVPKITPEDLQGGVRPYSLTDHIHEREASRHLQQLFSSPSEDFKVAFVPAVAPWFQGIISTMSAPLSTKMTAGQVKELYEEFYRDNGGLVEIGTKVPEIFDISLKHGIKIGGIQVHSSGTRVVVVDGLDNILKGAATQCIQVSLRKKPSICLFDADSFYPRTSILHWATTS
jgi:N-acetyl-gamma-glutamyl-phosphate reductase/acetylglutamate kinase